MLCPQFDIASKVVHLNFSSFIHATEINRRRRIVDVKQFTAIHRTIMMNWHWPLVMLLSFWAKSKRAGGAVNYPGKLVFFHRILLKCFKVHRLYLQNESVTTTAHQTILIHAVEPVWTVREKIWSAATLPQTAKKMHRAYRQNQVTNSIYININ